MMLQQTQVAMVVPFFRRFIERFPTVTALAAASIDEVLPYWAGLGYYRRCHHLHAAAREIVGRFGGSIPHQLGSLRSLPGIGEYSAGAIASIVFGARVPAVDGNVRRVLGRLAGLDGAAHPHAGLGGGHHRAAFDIADQLVPARRPGDFNQALMELGARVCVPRAPKCGGCPLAALCRFRRDAAADGDGGATGAPSQAGRPIEGKRGAPDSTTGMPRRPRNAGRKSVVIVTLAVRRDGMLLYRKRPLGGLWAGLWSWPEAVCDNSLSFEQAAAELWRDLQPRSRRQPRHFHTLAHDLTHRRIRFEAFSVDTRDGGIPAADGQRWIAESDIAALAQSTAQRKLAAALAEALNGRGIVRSRKMAGIKERSRASRRPLGRRPQACT